MRVTDHVLKSVGFVAEVISNERSKKLSFRTCYDPAKGRQQMSNRDPWGPLSGVLYELPNSEKVKNIVAATGVIVDWAASPGTPFDGNETRIRRMRPLIDATYLTLPLEDKGPFSQVIAKRLIEERPDLESEIEDRLNDIGWSVESGTLATQDVVLSEKFFGPGTQHDAFVAIRDILQSATHELTIVDGYMGEDLLTAIGSGPNPAIQIKLLTTQLGLAKRPDLMVEAQKFKQQWQGSSVEVRIATDFHDRFIVVDETHYHHVGASIKDAGTKAFVISRLLDAPVVESVREYIKKTWDKA